jgi:RND superfamily putative drug exporter
VSGAFAAWGRVVHRHPWPVLGGSLALLVVSVLGLLHAGALVSSNGVRGSLEAQRASDLVNAEITAGAASSGSSFLLLFGSRDRHAGDPAYRADLESAVAPLGGDPRVTAVGLPYDTSGRPLPGRVSRDGTEALVVVSLRDSTTTAQRYYGAIRQEVRPTRLTVQATGNVPLNQAFNTTLETDLRRAEVVSLPIVLVLLLLIFGSVLAALLPLGVGLLTIAGGLGGTLLLANVFDVSQYALNVVTLVGLGVSIDYSLFVVNRFREELAAGRAREDALAATMATAGRAITFSGLTVAVGLSALLFYQGTFMASMGAAGTIVVGIAIVYGLTFLPALLALLGPRVDRLRLPLPRRGAGPGVWGRIATGVMRRPVVVLAPTLGLLLVAGTPFLSIRLANGDVDMLPPGNEARQAYDTLRTNFPGYNQTTFSIVVRYAEGGPATAQHAAETSALAARIAAIPGVLRVTPGGTGPHVAVLAAVSDMDASGDGARAILRQVRAQHVNGAELLVTGATAEDVDVIDFIQSRTPYAVGFVIAVTLVLLFLLTGSVLLPLKAVLTNLVSISASFGALVWIFQQGHLSGQLGFTPQSIDPSIPVILFAIVFGLSMDYEVLLVSRIQEEYVRTGDNMRAVAAGLARTGRLITGAAAIMVVVFLAFGLAQVVLIKAIGIGLAVAVTLDATLVRGLIVPSVMRLLGRANWWAPAPLRWVHRLAGLAETPLPRDEAGREEKQSGRLQSPVI